MAGHSGQGQARPAEQAQSSDTVNLRVYVAGNGAVEALVDGVALPPDDGDDDPRHAIPMSSLPIRAVDYTVPRNTTVVLRPTPESVGFDGWSASECPEPEDCRLVLDDRTDVVATFDPLELHLIVHGEGTVERSPPGDECATPSPFCARYAPGTEVVLTAKPTNPGDPTEWYDDTWCEPETTTLTRVRSAVRVSGSVRTTPRSRSSKLTRPDAAVPFHGLRQSPRAQGGRRRRSRCARPVRTS